MPRPKRRSKKILLQERERLKGKISAEDIYCQAVGASVRRWRKGQLSMMPGKLDQPMRLIELAEIVTISQGSLSDIENGVSFPSFLTVKCFKRAYPLTNWDTVFMFKD